jgi:hypothetical protein
VLGGKYRPIFLGGILLIRLRGSPSHGSFANLSRSLPHRTERCVRRELRNWTRKVFIQRIAALLLNLAILVAMTAVKSGLFHSAFAFLTLAN